MSTHTHLVIGGTGKTGSRVLSRLQARGETVRSASRPGFDWGDRSTWAATLHGATTAYLAYAPDLAFPGAPDTVADLVRLAAGSGVRRVVLLSGRGEPEAQRAERLLAEVATSAGVEWAVVRAAFFAQNFSEDFFAGPVAEGRVRFVAGDVGEPFVDADDIADVATALLLGDAPLGRVHEVTGPRLLTFAEAMAELGVSYEQVTAAEMLRDLTAGGLDDDDAHGLVDLFTTVLDGRNASTTDGVSRALGRPPRDFTAFAAGLAVAAGGS